jgi:hypothetical protein
MKNRVKFASVLAAMFIASGCVKYTYSVDNVTPELDPTGKGTIAVASQDQRSYVVSGKYKPQVVGVIRGGFGNPLNMTTASGRPLADEMGDVITDALKKNGFKTTPVVVAATEPIEQVRKKLTDTRANRLIHFQVKQWRSDTFNNIRLEYILNITVMNTKGKALAKKEISGDENLGWGSGFDPVGTTRKKVPKAFEEKLEELFDAPDIIKALEQ